jgi:hypothetical protein
VSPNRVSPIVKGIFQERFRSVGTARPHGMEACKAYLVLLMMLGCVFDGTQAVAVKYVRNLRTNWPECKAKGWEPDCVALGEISITQST